MYALNRDGKAEIKAAAPMALRLARLAEAVQPEARVQAWVKTDAIQGKLQAAIESSPPSWHGVVPALSIVVPTNRIRRLRDAIIQHSVKMDMDWAALDEL